MNLLPCSFDADTGTLRNEEFEYSVDEDVATQVREADTAEELIFGVRPMDLTLAEVSSERTIEATVQTVEPIGERTHLTTTVGNTEVTVETDNEAGGELHGATIDLRPERFYLYDESQSLLLSAQPKDVAVADGGPDG